MKTPSTGAIALLLLAGLPSVSPADTFFSDTFGGGSTLNSTTPAAPTPTSTAYQIISSKSWSPTPSIASGDLKYGIGSTKSGSIEVQGRFAGIPVTLVNPGDYVELTITFTNTSAMDTSTLGFGLYNSGGSGPLPGGTNNATTSVTINGFAQHWLGYVGQIGYGGANSRVMTRPDQTVASLNGNNQDLVTSGSGSSSYVGASTVTGSTLASSWTLSAGGTYTLDLVITLQDANTLALTTTIYSGVDTTGTMVAQFGGTAAAPFLTAGFDAFAIGWRYGNSVAGPATTIDISKILVTGHATAVTGPPEITSEPASASAPVGGAVPFTVEATGYAMTYQWHRNGTNLVNGGNISGASSSTLVISPVSAADVASSYYVTINGAGGFSTNSTTASLSLRTPANLTWSGSSSTWDVNTTQDWLSGGNPAYFNYGDNVTFDDTGIGNPTVVLSDSFLSASSVTVNASQFNDYVFQGNGSIAGSGKLNYIGAGHLTINNANSYSGGTLISNSTAYLVLNNYAGLGTGPVTLGLAGGQMELVNSGNASTGINGDVIVQDDFTIMYDANSSYGAVFLGNLAGTAGKTLTLTHNNLNAAASRVRVYGENTVCAANIALSNPETTFASYQSTGTQTYNGAISGQGAFMQKGTTTYLNGPNTYSGGTTPATGTIALGIDSVGSNPMTSGPIGTGPLFLAPDSTTSTTGSGTIMAWNGARTVANPIQYLSSTNNLTLIIGGSNNLALAGDITLNGNDGTTGPMNNRVFTVNNTGLTTFSGVISDASPGYGITKSGTGVLALNNTETYTGPTFVTNGTLQVNGQLGSGSVIVTNIGVLAGVGTIPGPVTVYAGASIAPGDSIGTLTINNNLTLGGNLAIEVNKSASPKNDKLVVNGTLANTGTGTLTVTNLGSALTVGDSFTIFNKALANGGALTITGGGSSVTWTNKLAIDGSIAVLSVVPTSPTNVTYSVSGGSLTLSWPANYTGWTLEAQTNAPGSGISTNWTRISGSASVNQMSFPINPANSSVFFRLVYP